MEFEYDPAKSAKNLAKHGIDFEAAQRMWDNSKTVTLTAPNPGNDDVALHRCSGMIDGKHWTAITTKRGQAHTHHIRAPITQERGGIL